MNISRFFLWSNLQSNTSYWLLINCLFLLPAFNLSGQSIPKGAALDAVILRHDSLFWTAYNACDLETMISFVDQDAEFYHDKGGRLDGAANLKAAMKRGLCAGDHNRTERKPVAETIKVFPIAGVGAILRGQHTFHSTINSNDKDIAYFFHLWELKSSGWIMTRIFSYDHNPLPVNAGIPSITLSASALSKFVGTYKAPQTGTVSIKANENGLSLVTGGEAMPLLAKSPTVFFSKQLPLEFIFTVNEQGIATKFSVLEHGSKVEEAVRVE